MLNVLAAVSALMGCVLVGTGLYRRDRAAQRRVQRARSWVARKVFRRKPVSHSGVTALHGHTTLAAEGMNTPLKADPSAPLPERVARLEENTRILSRTIKSQAEARRQGDRKLGGRVAALADSVSAREAEVRRLIDEVSAPERTEWWGLLFFVIGGVLAVLGAVVG